MMSQRNMLIVPRKSTRVMLSVSASQKGRCYFSMVASQAYEQKLVRVMGVEETTGSPLEKEIVVLILIFVGILDWTIDLLDLHVALIPDVFNRFRNVQRKSSYVPQTKKELNGEIHAPLLKAHVQIRSKNLRAFSENSTKKDVRRHNTICIDKSDSHGEAKFLHLSHYPDIGRLSLIT